MKKILFSLFFIMILSACGQTVVENNERKILNDASDAIEGVLSVEWKRHKQISSLQIFPTRTEENDRIYEKIFFEDTTKYFSVGEVKNGKYQGYEVITVLSMPNMPVYFESIFLFLRHQKELLLLSQYSEEFDRDIFHKPIVTIDEIIVPKMQPPEYIFWGDAKLILEHITPVWFEEQNLEVAFRDDQWGDVFMEQQNHTPWRNESSIFESNALFLPLANGLTAIYSLQIPFILENTPQVKWHSTSNNISDQYTYSEGSSCGFRKGTFANVVTNELIFEKYSGDSLGDIQRIPFRESDMSVSGTTDAGEDIYSFRDNQHEFLRRFYKEYYSAVFSGVNDGIVVSYEEFVARNPFFFWRDPFDRLILFINMEFYLPPACGAKPVIYLYPEKQQYTSVQIDTSKKLFSSFPEYRDGWNVLASPTGELNDIKTQRVYPYLFWEDLLQYDPPSEGFVIRKEEISYFLSQILTQFGLNTKEVGDFMEFWLPKMQESPFYFVTFLHTEKMNEIAPLEITPEPDTMLRVFMHFEELETPLEVSPLDIPPFQRKGFTVVEWGGKLGQ